MTLRRSMAGFVLAVAGLVSAPAAQHERPSGVPAVQPTNPRAMWVWSSEALLGDPLAQQRLWQFCRERNITTLWMQITTGRVPPLEPFGLQVTRSADWRSLLSAAHRAGLRVEALDGDPTYAVRQYHFIPLAIVDAVIAFNLDAPPDERFDGVHFDNEPHLLPAWHDPAAREALLRDYLELSVESQRRIRERSTMGFGVDVPFWWHTRDARTGGPIANVTFRGIRQAATLHGLDLLDTVSLMNYRNVALGPDGLISNGRGLLAYTATGSQRRARVYMGVETSVLRPARIWFVGMLAYGALAGTSNSPWRPGLARDRFTLHTFADGTTVYLGLALPEGREPAPGDAVFDALLQLAQQFGAAADGATVEAGIRAIKRAPEWQSPQQRGLTDPASGRRYAGFEATYAPLSKTTFAAHAVAEMERELGLAEAQFRTFDGYAGLAIHDYDAYRQLAMDRAPQIARHAIVPRSAAGPWLFGWHASEQKRAGLLTFAF